MAIRLKVRKAEGEYDLGASKFLGSPTLPKKWEKAFDSNTIFLMQIRLEDIKELDIDNVLPHKGYLYFFLDVTNGEYSLEPIVKYYSGEPTLCLNGFNDVVDGYEQFVDDWLIEFEKCDDSETGNKLLGIPNDWNSRVNTLNDSGIEDSGILLPSTIASNVLSRAIKSSDLIVIISLNVCAAP